MTRLFNIIKTRNMLSIGNPIVPEISTETILLAAAVRHASSKVLQWRRRLPEFHPETVIVDISSKLANLASHFTKRLGVMTGERASLYIRARTSITSAATRGNIPAANKQEVILSLKHSRSSQEWSGWENCWISDCSNRIFVDLAAMIDF
jgi:hypothetical protein